MQRLAMSGGRLEVALEPLEAPAAGGLEAWSSWSRRTRARRSRRSRDVASGGELSRISLAIQVLLFGEASVPTLIFDEVDAGIGGGVAEVVGRLLQSLGARSTRCSRVTHLAQVAVHARAAAAREQAGGPRGDAAPRCEPLDAEERVDEIARMLGGLKITEATRRHAAGDVAKRRAQQVHRYAGEGRAAAGSR